MPRQVLFRITSRITSVTMVLVALSVSITCKAQKREGVMTMNDKILLGKYLLTAGIRADCYFTLEDHRLPDLVSAFDTAYVMDDANITTVDGIVAKLRKALSFATVVRNKENPAVINIIEASLPQLPRYVLERRASLQFSGTLYDLVITLKERFDGRIGYARGGDVSRAFEDGVTQVKVGAKDLTLRSILTNYIPFSQYNRILWNAETLEVDGKTETWVQHYGGGFSTDRQPIADTLIPFSEGEVAYARNANSEEASKSAIDYIQSQFATGKTRQVRWAMLFLARSKTYQSIPLLLKHLEYRYTTVPVVEEAFPAVRALIEMGKPAASAALTQIKSEDDMHKLELLASIVMRIYGPDEGRRQIEAAASDIPETRKHKLMGALAKMHP